MIIKINKYFLTFIIYIITTKPALANGIDLSGQNPVQETDLKSFLIRIIGILTIIAGIVFLIMLLYGGITYMTASGNPENETKAKNTLIWAIIGLVIAVMAGAIINYLTGGISSIFGR